jgi:hypothetical protein
MKKSSNGFVNSLFGQFENPKPNSILYNRALLYFIFFLALFQLYTFSVSGNATLAITFLLVGFLTSFFSKNMIVILVISLVFTGILQFGVSTTNMEGMQEGNDQKIAPADVDASDDESVSSKETRAKKPSIKKLSPEKEKAVKDELVADGQQLEKLQEVILSKFKEISPVMTQAEGLVEKMQGTAESLQNIQ